MLIERNYTLREFLLWTRRKLYLLAALSAIPVVLYEVFEVRWLAIPWGIVFLLGTTVALSAGFKNLQTYGRMQEAQQIWSSIASSSRAWGTSCRDLVADSLLATSLVNRHLAWLAALRHEMRRQKPWESADKPYNAEYRRHYSIPEREQLLSSELARYLSPGEAAQVLGSRNQAYQVLALQSAETRRLLVDGLVTPAGCAELQRAMREFLDQQGRSERIKLFPYPRQHAFIHSLFVRIMCVLLPFGMIGEFEALNDVVGGWAQGHMVWLVIPMSLLVSWMYTSLDQVGESTENPFEGGANDVPITRICEEIERDLREMLGESRIPELSRRESGIAL